MGLFRPTPAPLPQRSPGSRWVPTATLAGTIKDLSPSGTTITFSPTVTLVKTARLAPADNITFAETVTLVKTAVLAPATTIRFTETTNLVKTAKLSPSVNITFTETTTLVATRVLAPLANIVFAESVALVRISASATSRMKAGFAPAILYLLEKFR